MRMCDRDRDRGSLPKRSRGVRFRGKDHRRVSVRASVRPQDEKENRSSRNSRRASRRSLIGDDAENVDRTEQRRETIPIVSRERSRNQSRAMAVLLLLLLQPSRTPASGESILVLSWRYFYLGPNGYIRIYGRLSSRFDQLRNGGSTRLADLCSWLRKVTPHYAAASRRTPSELMRVGIVC